MQPCGGGLMNGNALGITPVGNVVHLQGSRRRGPARWRCAMSSAWGNSWGSSWGTSWGALTPHLVEWLIRARRRARR